MLSNGEFNAVLFDLDGTLVDTAPDMVSALQELQRDHGYEPIPYAEGRANVSNGALGLLKVAFPDLDDVVRKNLIGEYIDRYKDSICVGSAVFGGLDTLLEHLDRQNRPWGVVTNKPAYLTESLLQRLLLADRCACIVSGDTLETRKPDPGPLLYACEVAGIEAQSTIYVGDAARDIEAGRAAGMATIAAAYGYITADDDPLRWDADLIVADTEELSQAVCKAVNLIVS